MVDKDLQKVTKLLAICVSSLKYPGKARLTLNEVEIKKRQIEELYQPGKSGSQISQAQRFRQKRGKEGEQPLSKICIA